MSTFAGTSIPFDAGNIGYDPPLPSHRLDSLSDFESESVTDSAGDSSPYFASKSYNPSDDLISPHPVPETLTPPSNFSPEQNGKGFNGGLAEPDGPILLSPAAMEPEEGFPLTEWRRLNAIRLEEKEKREKEMLEEIIEEANQYIIDFYRRRKLSIENNKASNRDKEKQYLANREKFHAEAENNYWKPIAELIPNEIPTIEKGGKKEKKPSIVVIQGPKPGKPTDLSRMRQILLKLKHNNPSHMKPKPPPPPPSSESKKDPTRDSSAAGSSSSSASTSSAIVATSEGKAAA